MAFRYAGTAQIMLWVMAISGPVAGLWGWQEAVTATVALVGLTLISVHVGGFLRLWHGDERCGICPDLAPWERTCARWGVWMTQSVSVSVVIGSLALVFLFALLAGVPVSLVLSAVVVVLPVVIVSDMGERLRAFLPVERVEEKDPCL